MAKAARRLPMNVPGDFFVDESCIDCGTCRVVAPAVFAAGPDAAYVATQPIDATTTLRAEMALLACPTGSIGTAGKHALAAAQRAFPDPVVDGVLHCGYHHEASYGAASYLIRRPEGNVLVDSPRFALPLVRRLEELGGVAIVFLTHRDDVADHARFAAHFGARRVMHEADVTASTRDVEDVLSGDGPRALARDLVVIPTPGHTRGSACLLFEERVLFTGDHLAWSPRRGALTAFDDACWYDWRVQIESMRRLLAYSFTSVLPGHGHRATLASVDEMHRAVAACVDWMCSRV